MSRYFLLLFKIASILDMLLLLFPVLFTVLPYRKAKKSSPLSLILSRQFSLASLLIGYLLINGKEQKIAEAKTITSSVSDQGHFSLETAPGKTFPAGEYKVDFLTGNEILGSASFKVQP